MYSTRKKEIRLRKRRRMFEDFNESFGESFGESFDVVFNEVIDFETRVYEVFQ